MMISEPKPILRCHTLLPFFVSSCRNSYKEIEKAYAYLCVSVSYMSFSYTNGSICTMIAVCLGLIHASFYVPTLLSLFPILPSNFC